MKLLLTDNNHQHSNNKNTNSSNTCNSTRNNRTYKNLPPLEIYCRLRPNNTNINKKANHIINTNINNIHQQCLKVLSTTTIKLIQPDNFNYNRYDSNYSLKENYFNFKKIFDEHSTQSDIYKNIGLPFVRNLIKGHNSLIFLYGQSGSGKTYTMNGDQNNYGLLPRCINTIFRNILKYPTDNLIFRQDKFNNFYLFNCGKSIHVDRNNNQVRDEIRQLKSLSMKYKFDESIEDDFMLSTENDVYGLYITYIEIYNNSIYDLLDERGVNKWQNKPIREDNAHKVFVHGIKEVEVKSVDEALDLFYKAQKRRKTEYTATNSDSSRSHTIFTVKLIQTSVYETDESNGSDSVDAGEIIQSQLSFVDLAGGERTTRTKNTGQRLREAGNINNSLMTLRYCLEILRENQLNEVQKMIPYRDTKITHMFKNFFEGDGHVSLFTCLYPTKENFDETYKALKFSGDIQVTRSPSVKLSPIIVKRKKPKLNNEINNLAPKPISNTENKDNRKNIDIYLNNNTDADVKNYNTETECNDVISDLMKFFENRVKKKQAIRPYNDKNHNHIEKEFQILKDENNKLLDLIDDEKQRNRTLEHDINQFNDNIKQYMAHINELKNLLNIERTKYAKLENDTRYQDYHLNNLLEEEKMKNTKLEKMFRDCTIEMKELKANLGETRESADKMKIDMNLTIEKLKNKIQRKDILINDLNKQILEARNLEKINKRLKSRKSCRYIRSAENLKFDTVNGPTEPTGVTGIFIKHKLRSREIAKTDDTHKKMRPKTINTTAMKRKDRFGIDAYDF